MMDEQSFNYYCSSSTKRAKYRPYLEVPEKSYYDKDLEGAAPFLYSDALEKSYYDKDLDAPLAFSYFGERRRSNENKDRKGDE